MATRQLVTSTGFETPGTTPSLTGDNQKLTGARTENGNSTDTLSLKYYEISS